jgi:hypothetical protein
MEDGHTTKIKTDNSATLSESPLPESSPSSTRSRGRTSETSTRSPSVSLFALRHGVEADHFLSRQLSLSNTLHFNLITLRTRYRSSFVHSHSLRSCSFTNTDLPLDLRYKKTRAIRRRLTTKEQSAITVKQHKKNIHFPARRFALKA